VIADELIDTLKPQQLRQALRSAQAETVSKSELIARQEREVAFKQAPSTSSRTRWPCSSG
jgi:hypothetical protein